MIRLLIYLFDVVASLLLARMLARGLQQRGAAPRFHPWSRREGSGDGPPRGPEGAIRGETARDPICGMFVSTELSEKSKQGGRTLHFCSTECRDRYQKEHGRTG